MKIAFVGKGGSGKSTLSALFTSYVILSDQGSVLLIDADTNMHSGTYFGASYDENKFLSKQENTEIIKKRLIADNTRIESTNHMVKTTPPGEGSYTIMTANDPLLKLFDVAGEEKLNLVAVGGYTSEHAGTSCYHTSLSIVENILSHMDLKEKNFCVVDMVASTDAFSNTFHIQFDCIVLIVEPTRESLSLVKTYIELARETHVQDKILIIGNKIEGEDDLEYIEHELEQKIASYLSYDQSLKKYMRTADTIHGYVSDRMSTMEKIFADVLSCKPLDRKEQLQKLTLLHKKYSSQSYITNALGDLSGQIDTAFIENVSH